MGQELSLKTIYVLADGEGMLKQPLATNSLAVLQSAMFSIIKGCWLLNADATELSSLACCGQDGCRVQGADDHSVQRGAQGG